MFSRPAAPAVRIWTSGNAAAPVPTFNAVRRVIRVVFGMTSSRFSWPYLPRGEYSRQVRLSPRPRGVKSHRGLHIRIHADRLAADRRAERAGQVQRHIGDVLLGDETFQAG